MNWKILNVSIPVKNLEKSKDFYNTLLDNNLEEICLETNAKSTQFKPIKIGTPPILKPNEFP